MQGLSEGARTVGQMVVDVASTGLPATLVAVSIHHRVPFRHDLVVDAEAVVFVQVHRGARHHCRDLSVTPRPRALRLDVARVYRGQQKRFAFTSV